MTLSSITISGTISKDAEQRYTPNNNSVINFMMTILRYDSREKAEKSYPVKVNLWGDNYTELLDRLKVGARVIVSGRLELDQYTDRAGKNVRVAVIEANAIHFVDSLKNVGAGQPVAMAAASAVLEDINPAASEEIPF